MLCVQIYGIYYFMMGGKSFLKFLPLIWQVYSIYVLQFDIFVFCIWIKLVVDKYVYTIIKNVILVPISIKLYLSMEIS